MNHCIFIGRLTHEPELQMKDKADSQTYWCRFRIAVNREFSQKEEADFFTCLVFGGKARYLTSYARMAAVSQSVAGCRPGSMRNGMGQKDMP